MPPSSVIGHRFIQSPRRETALAAAKELLEESRGKSWQKLVRERIGDVEGAPYCERLSEEELEKSADAAAGVMSGYHRDYYRTRSRSVDLSWISRSASAANVATAANAMADQPPKIEKYLSRWSRENTPVDNEKRYASHVRRSYTPVREIASADKVEDPNPRRARTPLAMVTAPYHTNIHYRSEDEPFRKYDVFGLRTWSYPIYKYVYGREPDSRRPYSFLNTTLSRTYGNTPLYTPPQMTSELRPITTRRGYSGYSYLANETNYDIASKPRSLMNYFYTKHYLGTTSAPWYWSYYGNSGLRHFNAYRPHNYTLSTSSWRRYY